MAKSIVDKTLRVGWQLLVRWELSSRDKSGAYSYCDRSVNPSAEKNIIFLDILQKEMYLPPSFSLLWY